MRVLDVLRCDAGDEIENPPESNRSRRRRGGLAPPPASSAATFDSLTPRSLLSRWLRSFQKPPPGGGRGLGCRVRFPRYRSDKRRKGEKGEGEGEGREGMIGPSVVGPAADPGGAAAALSTESAAMEEGRVGPGASGSAEPSASSGRRPEGVFFNLCIGWGLFFLLAKTSTELNKMIELQKHMEILLKDIKEGIRRQDVASSFTASNNNPACSESNWFLNESTSNHVLFQNDGASHHLGAHGGMEPDRQSMCGTTFMKKQCQKMNQLEVELEVELERMRLNLEGENSFVLPQTHKMEFDSENSDPSESYSISFVEANEPKEECSSRQCGVSPRELERRLHELLETRQQERIVELESALECAARKLHEKELEMCWWRDTARLVSKNMDEALFR